MPQEERYIQEALRKPAADFVNGPIWREIKRCALESRPPKADVKDPSHVAAAIGHQRAAWDDVIKAIEEIPFDFSKEQRSPFSRPAVAITKD